MKKIILKEENIAQQIFFIRGEKVMLDSDLAQIYQVSTARLNEPVKRNRHRFPKDFMFRVTPSEWRNLISQIATSRWNVNRYSFTNFFTTVFSSSWNCKK
ncbi:MAG: ORF6N domain-containing protein [Bacteroidetes bacterium]|nr:ORF6N domain-containing protein [Bacteroidota bacterium]